MPAVKVSSAFDSGNIEVVDASDHMNVQLKIRPDPYCKHDDTTHFQWFHFRVSGCKALPLTLKLVNAGKASFTVAWPGYVACASYDTEDWFRVAKTSWDEKAGVLTFQHTPEHDSIFLAYFAPYTLVQHQRLVAQTQKAKFTKLEVLGQTVDGRDLDLLTIGEPGEGKLQIWITARQHPGESMAEWFMEGLLQTLTAEHNAFSHRLLRKAVFYVVPNCNPDGSYRGHLRTNAKGANLNREWRDTTVDYSPEVFYIRQRMDETGVDLYLDIHGDEELSFNFLAGSEGIPSWNTEMAKAADAFKVAFERATPDFQNKAGYGIDEPGKADMSIASNAVGERFNCLSFTLEMPFKDTQDSPDSVHGWSPLRAKDFGASLLAPIYEVLPLLKHESRGTKGKPAPQGEKGPPAPKGDQGGAVKDGATAAHPAAS